MLWQKMENKWLGLENASFRFVDLGRPAVFLLPVAKINREYVKEKRIHDFLVEHFGAFSYATISNFGVWVDGQKKIVYDECRLYEVSFVGKERITLLAEFLAHIALAIDEQCLYFKAGQYAALIYPK